MFRLVTAPALGLCSRIVSSTNRMGRICSGTVQKSMTGEHTLRTGKEIICMNYFVHVYFLYSVLQYLSSTVQGMNLCW